ncbi:MAG: hypothetical protein MMC23_008212 [Stictis urceolatum]|nr:hypothetical protein [Stictis urceolata]
MPYEAATNNATAPPSSALMAPESVSRVYTYVQQFRAFHSYTISKRPHSPDSTLPPTSAQSLQGSLPPQSPTRPSAPSHHIPARLTKLLLRALVVLCSSTTILGVLYYNARADRMARWTAAKDFLSTCQSSALEESAGCRSFKGKVLDPPPYGVEDFLHDSPGGRDEDESSPAGKDLVPTEPDGWMRDGVTYQRDQGPTRGFAIWEGCGNETQSYRCWLGEWRPLTAWMRVRDGVVVGERLAREGIACLGADEYTCTAYEYGDEGRLGWVDALVAASVRLGLLVAVEEADEELPVEVLDKLNEVDEIEAVEDLLEDLLLKETLLELEGVGVSVGVDFGVLVGVVGVFAGVVGVFAGVDLGVFGGLAFFGERSSMPLTPS